MENQQAFRDRQDLVDSAYLADEAADVLDVFAETGAQYLVVGSVERRKYAGFMPDFAGFLDVAYAAGDYAVYRLPQFRVVATS
jgi:hypothetical protein